MNNPNHQKEYKVFQENITGERGIPLRRNRSIQVEGAFGLLKSDFGFRRFLTTGKKNIRVERFFLALGFNLKKRWMKQEKSRRCPCGTDFKSFSSFLLHYDAYASI